MKKLRMVLVPLAFTAITGPIAWGLLGDAATARDRALLDEIQRAEETAAFTGVRTITVDHPDGAVTTVLRVLGSAGERHVEFVEARLPSGEIRRPDDKSKRAAPGPFSWLGRLRGIASGRGHGGRMSRFSQSAAILENYQLLRQGRETIAGRAADRFELHPRFAGRAAYRLWADAATRLLLRFQVLAAGGGVACDISHESVSFRPVSLPPPAKPGPGELPIRIERQALSREDLRGLGFQAWLPDRRPAGFELRSTELVQVKGLFEAEGVQAWYSDGMASIVLVEFRADNPFWQRLRPLIPGLGNPGDSFVARRLTHPGGTLINVTLEGTEVFAAGQVGGDELEAMVRSLKKAN